MSVIAEFQIVQEGLGTTSDLLILVGQGFEAARREVDL